MIHLRFTFITNTKTSHHSVTGKGVSYSLLYRYWAQNSFNSTETRISPVVNPVFSHFIYILFDPNTIFVPFASVLSRCEIGLAHWQKSAKHPSHHMENHPNIPCVCVLIQRFTLETENCGSCFIGLLTVFHVQE